MKKLKLKTDKETNTFKKKVIFTLLNCTVIGYLLFFDELYVKYFYTTYYENRKIFRDWLKENELSKPDILCDNNVYYKKWKIDGYEIFFYNNLTTDNEWFIIDKNGYIYSGTFISGKYDKKLYNEIMEILKNA